MATENYMLKLVRLGVRGGRLSPARRRQYEEFYLKIVGAWSVDQLGLTGNQVHILTPEDVKKLEAETERLEALDAADRN